MFRNKILKNTLVLSSILCIPFSFLDKAQAQNTVSTPYSQFGLGQVLNNSSVINLGMGGIKNGIRYDNAINISNPASLSALRYTTFEVGAFATLSKMSSLSGTAQGTNAAMSYLKVAFPFTDKWGTSFGLVPFSGVGYESRIQGRMADTPVTNVYSGSGGLNQFYIATSYEVYKGLSIGINANYIFGSIDRSKSAEFPDSLAFTSARVTNSTYIGSLLLNFGIQYHKTFSNGKYITLGLSDNLPTNLNATRNTLSKRYFVNGLGNEQTIDTISISNDEKGKIEFPMLNSIGFSYGKINKFMIGADLSTGQWSNLVVYGQNQNLQNTFDLSLGGFIIPKHDAVGNYLKTIEYRMGFNYGKSYVSINNQNINQYSVNFGFGLPLPRSASRINLGFEYGIRGTQEAGLIKEEFLGIHAGFNFCDKWFMRRKYD